MYNKCCVVNCGSRRKDVNLYRFPKTEIGLNKWLQCINSENLRSLSLLELRKQHVCQKHFEKRFLASQRIRARLRANAYPTLFTEDEISSGIPRNPTTTLKCKYNLKYMFQFNIKLVITILLKRYMYLLIFYSH